MSYGTVQAEKMTTESGYSLGAGNASSFKNRIINGAMVIDQRNAGASVTPTITAFPWPYCLDRYNTVQTQASKFSVQRNAGSVTPPAGFTNYLGITSLSAYSLAAGDIFTLQQRIEGNNVSDLAFGTASAKSITVSFWVRSSIAGNFGGNIHNESDNRFYSYSYAINAANTWEYKSVTIPGDVTGTWNTGTGIGIVLNFIFGAGSNYQGTGNTWTTSSQNYAPSGSTSIVGTNGATFYITGVQLEVGTVATSFDYRSFTTELALCQRYYETSFPIGTAPANGVASLEAGSFAAFFSGGGRADITYYKVTKRTNATITYFRGTTHTSDGLWSYYDFSIWRAFTSNGTGTSLPYAFYMFGERTGSFTNGLTYLLDGNWTASAEL